MNHIISCWKIFVLIISIGNVFVDCGPVEADHLSLTCYNNTLTLHWRTNNSYGGDISEIPADLKSTLNEKIAAKGRAFTLFVFDNTPKWVVTFDIYIPCYEKEFQERADCGAYFAFLY